MVAVDRGERSDGGRVETLPLFPLGTVLLPGAALPLHVFEPRYRQLTIDLLTGAVPGKQFGVGRVTVSVGVAVMDSDETPEQILRRADESLYHAKAAGKNWSSLKTISLVGTSGHVSSGHGVS